MEKLSERRRSEEETYLWCPFRFLDQILKAIFECFGLLHRDSSTKTASSAVTLNQSEEEEDDVVMEEEVIVTTRGFKNGVVVSSRGVKVKAKKKDKERHSSGAPGKHG